MVLSHNGPVEKKFHAENLSFSNLNKTKFKLEQKQS